jgi:hypothetical protein
MRATQAIHALFPSPTCSNPLAIPHEHMTASPSARIPTPCPTPSCCHFLIREKKSTPPTHPHSMSTGPYPEK